MRVGPVWGATSFGGRRRVPVRVRGGGDGDTADLGLVLVALVVALVVALPLLAVVALVVLFFAATLVVIALLTSVLGLLFYGPAGLAFLVDRVGERVIGSAATRIAVHVLWAAQAVLLLWMGYVSIREWDGSIAISAVLLMASGYLGGLAARSQDRERAGRELGLVLGLLGIAVATRLGPSNALQHQQAAAAERARLAALAEAQHQAEIAAAVHQRQQQIDHWWSEQPPPAAASLQRACPRCAESVQPAAIACWRCAARLVPYATWATDPSARYASRYWNRGWTHHVADAHGRNTTDPLGPQYGAA